VSRPHVRHPLDDGTSLWIFFGVSMLVAAAKGYAGCEVLAIPNLVLRRRDSVYCPVLTPIDKRDRQPTS
jgi:hypothetical protein